MIDAVRERRPRFVAADVIKEYAELLRSYGVHEVVSDKFAAGFSSDEWSRNGIRFKACDNSTAENFLFALPLLTSKRARLIDDATLRKQLSGLERRVVAGHEIVGHAQRAGAHDDVAAAVCGALVEAAALANQCMVVTPDLLARASAMPRSRAYGSSRNASLSMLLACRSPDPWPSAKKFNDEGA